MEKVIYKINLDVTRPEAQKSLTGFRIGETAARQLRMTLTNGKNPIHFAGTEMASMFVLKPSDETPSIGACSFDGDVIVYDVLQSDVSEDGLVTFTIKINDGTSVLFAASFEAQVIDPDCDDSHVPSDPTYSVLDTVLAEAQDIREDLDGQNENAEAWAVGTRGGVEVPSTDPCYHNNAKYWSAGAQAVTQEYIEQAEAWAAGTKNSVPVPSTDPAYQNNAKYYNEQATTAAGTATDAANLATLAASEATGAVSQISGYATTASNAASTASTAASTASSASSTATTAASTASTAATTASTAATTASTKASEASASATSAAASASVCGDAEAYAIGKRNGQDVPSTDPAYHNNSKYWAEQAAGATSGVTSFNARSGLVVPADGDYAIEQITPTSGTQGQVPMVNSQGKLEMANLPTTTQIQSDWNQSDDTAADFIKNKPSIPAAQVNADWNAASGAAQILNKPTIPAAQVNADWNASSGVAQILNKPTIPAAQIQSDWSQSTSSSLDYIKNKPTLGTAAAKDVPASGNAASTEVVLGSDSRLSDARTPTSHTHAASKVTAGTLGGKVLANATAVQTLSNKQVRNITIGTTALTSSDTLNCGDIYLQYEVNS